MYFCGDSVLLNESHWVIICIIRIFGQIFGQNFGIWPPGVPIYMGISYWFAIYFEEIPPSLVLNVFLWWLCIIKWPKLGNYLHNTNIWGDFWSKFWYLTPWGAYIYIYGCLLLVCHLNTTTPSPKCISGICVLSNGLNWEVTCIIPIFGSFLVKILIFDPPGCWYVSLPPTVSRFISKK